MDYPLVAAVPASRLLERREDRPQARLEQLSIFNMEALADHKAGSRCPRRRPAAGWNRPALATNPSLLLLGRTGCGHESSETGELMENIRRIRIPSTSPLCSLSMI
jgi:ABC-type branched-subunit amino acid transport system ATPase component